MARKSENKPTESSSEFWQTRVIVGGDRHFVRVNDRDELSAYAVPGGKSVSVKALKAWAESVGKSFELKKIYVTRNA